MLVERAGDDEEVELEEGWRRSQGWSPAQVQAVIDDDHCRRIEESAVLDADDSARVFLSSFAVDEELEMLSVSLRDPASFVRMTTPCRSFRCSHLQCVDRDVYQQLNAATDGHEYFMKCHVCNALRNPDKLYIDFVTLVWVTVFEEADYVHVHRDGRFELFDANRRKVPCTHVPRVAFVQVRLWPAWKHRLLRCRHSHPDTPTPSFTWLSCRWSSWGRAEARSRAQSWNYSPPRGPCTCARSGT